MGSPTVPIQQFQNQYPMQYQNMNGQGQLINFP